MQLPGKVTCSICGLKHDVETILEYPLPQNISAISSGKKQGEIKNLNKWAYIVDNDIYMMTSLKIPIIGYMDDFEIQNWIRIDSSEVNRVKKERLKFKNDDEFDFIELTGQMVYPVPMYSLSDYPLVKVSYPPKDLYPDVLLVDLNHDLYKDWKNGISKSRLQTFIEKLNHI